jgi:hypothetical protein
MKNITTFIFFIFMSFAQNAWAQGSFAQVYFPDTIGTYYSADSSWRGFSYDISPTPDGGYLTVGSITVDSVIGFSKPMVMKINSLGLKQWVKFIEYPVSTNYLEYCAFFQHILPLSDGNYLAIGSNTRNRDGQGFLTSPKFFYLYKYTPNGTELWHKEIMVSENNDVVPDVYQPGQYNFYNGARIFLSGDGHIIYADAHKMLKINQVNNAIIWQKNTPSITNLKPVCGTATSNGFVLIRADSVMVKYNEMGDTTLLTEGRLTNVYQLTATKAIRGIANDTIVLITREGEVNTLYKFDSNFSLTTNQVLDTIPIRPWWDHTDNERAAHYFIEANGKVYTLNTPFHSSYGWGPVTPPIDPLFHLNKFDTYGHLIFTKNITYPYPYFAVSKFAPLINDGIIITGNFAHGYYHNQASILKTNNQLQLLKKIPIKIYNDTNYNCIKGANETYKSPLELKLKLKSRESGQTLPVETDGQGNYWFYVNDHTFDVKTNLNTLWRVCGDSVHFTDLSGADTLILGIQPAQPCAALEVNIGNNRMRRCTTNVYHLQYYNSGTIASQNGYIDFKLDNSLTFDSASVAALPLGNNVFRFAVGSVGSLESGTIKVYFTVNCNSTIGQMHCSDAVIRPYLECRGDRLWDGSQIQVTAECDAPNHAARFFIKNIGTGDMATARNWGIIEDDIMGRDSVYFLRAGATDTIRVDSVDSDVIYRILVEQDPNHPAATVATAVLWCANTVNTHWQFVNQLAQDDGAAYTATNCTINRDSYDPNEKSVTPEGVGEQHAIPKNTPLEYKIQFQNTGNDTAYLVRIHDQLSANLDWKTLKTGASSHPYTYTLDSMGLLVFTFTNINLLDSTNHESESHGFVQFSIRQKKDLPIGASIQNTAHIYFDNNPPIITNTVSQTIGVRWATIVKQPTPPTIPPLSPLNVALVYPNPFNETCHFVLKNTDGEFAKTENASLRITDILGRVLVEKAFTNGQAELERAEIDIITGILFYQIQIDGRVWSAGKLLVTE